MNQDALVKRLLKEQDLENKIKATVRERGLSDSQFENYYLSTELRESSFTLTHETRHKLQIKRMSFLICKEDLDSDHYKNIVSVDLIKLIGTVCVMELEEFLRES